MRNEIPVEVLLHVSTGTALAWKMDFHDREYLTLRVSDENDLRFGAFSLDPISDEDGGPTHEPVSARYSKGKGWLKAGRQNRIGRKRRTFRDLN